VAQRRAFTVQAKTGERRRAATREDLLEATKRLLAEGAPLASLSVERICSEAGIVRSTFYLHFRDKYDLIEQLAAEQQAWIEAAGQSAMSDPEMTRATVRRILGSVVDHWAENHAVLAAIIELAEYDPRMREAWRRMIHNMAGVASTVFGLQWRSAGTEPAYPVMVSEVLCWMAERSCHEIARDPSRREALADSLAEVIWRVLHPALVQDAP
jgi:AcrR family transcriptional regulator